VLKKEIKTAVEKENYDEAAKLKKKLAQLKTDG